MDEHTYIIPYIKTEYVAWTIVLLLGALSGLFKFAVRYKDTFKMFLTSSEVIFFCFVSSCVSFFAYHLAFALKIDVAGLSFNDYPILVAVVAGIAGQDLALSIFPNQNDSSGVSSGFMGFIYAVRDWPFYRYSIKRNLRFLPHVDRIMPDVPYEQLHELISSCLGITKGLSDEDSAYLVNRIKEIESTYNSDSQKKNDIGLELAKIIGIELLEKVASQLQKDSQLEEAMSRLDIAMGRLK